VEQPLLILGVDAEPRAGIAARGDAGSRRAGARQVAAQHASGRGSG
jgi:hypothetical protein